MKNTFIVDGQGTNERIYKFSVLYKRYSKPCGISR